ncbi:MAG: ABC transporter substrate-binding protein [Acetobacteraceae bacterium]
MTEPKLPSRRGVAAGLAAGLATPFLGRTARGAELLRIGALFPLTGQLSVLGTEALGGAKIAVELANERGGVFGQQVALQTADVTSPANATNEARRLINRDGLKLLTGTYGSAIALAIGAAANQLKVTYFEGSAVVDELTERGYRFVFRLNDTSQVMAAAPLQCIESFFVPAIGKPIDQLKIAVIHEDGPFGTSIARDLVAQLGRKGASGVAVQPYPANSQDLSSLILRLKSEGADVVAATQYFNDAVLFWRQARDAGYNPRYFVATGSGEASPDFRRSIGADADGILVGDVFSMGARADSLTQTAQADLAEFLSRYRKAFGKNPASNATRHFSSMSVLLGTILPKAGSLDPERIRDAVLSIDEPLGSTILGFGIKVGEDGQNTRAFNAILQWQQGELATVWPERFATAPPISIPLPNWAERPKG